MVTTILFDLDGTLLPMEQEIFIKSYFKKLAAKMIKFGYDSEQLVHVIWQGMDAMINNDGSCTNEEAFWNCFMKNYGEESIKDKPIFDEYYKNEFCSVAESCGYNPKAKETVAEIKKLGYRVALATNPVFPAVATKERIRWTGLDADDFELITTYENSIYCKPNLAYYEEILKTIDCKAEECLMVGNDVSEDMPAEKLGMQVFLLTDCLINKKEVDISKYAHGGFEDLLNYVKNLK